MMQHAGEFQPQAFRHFRSRQGLPMFSGADLLEANPAREQSR